MATGKHSSSEWVIGYDDSPGGTLRTMTQHVLTIGGIKIENPQQLSHAFGDTFEESSPTGVRRIPPIQIGGLFDDTATTGPHAVFNVVAGDADPNGSTRSFSAQVATGGATFTVETRLVSYEVLGKNGNLTEYVAVVQPTGSGAWA
jgi:hypothetical protein